MGLPWRRERLQGYLTIFTVTNVVRELVGELNMRNASTLLRFSSPTSSLTTLVTVKIMRWP